LKYKEPGFEGKGNHEDKGNFYSYANDAKGWLDTSIKIYELYEKYMKNN